MSAISDYAAQVQTTFNEISTSVDGIAADIASLKTKIDQLQNSAGAITPEDQAILDSIQTKANDLNNRIKALDEATAPDEVPTPQTP